jgi:hypothetical protein
MFESSRARAARRTRHPALAGGLFVSAGLVAAFLVAAIAGIGGGHVPLVGEGDLPGAGGAAGPGGASQAALGEPAPPPPAAHVRVEVLNGAGVSGLAREATHRLRNDGFDVVFFGNAARFDHARSVVLDRTGDTATARRIAHALGIDSIASVPDATLLLDATVILGADWPPSAPERPTPLGRLQRLLVPGDSAR